MNIIGLAFLGYLLFRFIAGFLLPLLRTSRHMHQQFQNMQGKANPGPGNPHSNGHHTTEPSGTAKPGSSKVGEYIEFEEIN